MYQNIYTGIQVTRNIMVKCSCAWYVLHAVLYSSIYQLLVMRFSAVRSLNVLVENPLPRPRFGVMRFLLGRSRSQKPRSRGLLAFSLQDRYRTSSPHFSPPDMVGSFLFVSLPCYYSIEFSRARFGCWGTFGVCRSRDHGWM